MNPYAKAIRDGRITYEHREGHILVRFYQHENGNWCAMIFDGAGFAIITEESKRAIWDEARRIADLHRRHDIERGVFDEAGNRLPWRRATTRRPRQPVARPCPKL